MTTAQIITLCQLSRLPSSSYTPNELGFLLRLQGKSDAYILTTGERYTLNRLAAEWTEAIRRLGWRR